VAGRSDHQPLDVGQNPLVLGVRIHDEIIIRRQIGIRPLISHHR
jgi:hypothetical protein